MTAVAQVVTVGVLLGMIYTLVGLGMTLSLGVLGILNLTHGLAVVGGSILAFEVVRTWGLPVGVALALSIPLGFGAGVVMHVGLVRRAQRVSPESGLLVLFGAMLLLQAIAVQVWRSDTRTLSLSFSEHLSSFAGVTVRTDYAVAAAAAAGLLLVMWAVIRFTMFGRAVQALSQQPDAARILGVNADRYTTVVFGISMALATSSGVLLAGVFPFSVQTQTQWLAYAFIVVLVGGTGGVVNAAAGGLALGMGQAVLNELLPLTWVSVVVYGLLVLAMVARGGGLSAAKERAL
ncbi:branched-chain amino acid transport system permease protein [Thermocatellispora tengchongensis]|uniref:Branched-chain amino acid transport system permease protein n=1 Tax=Thermocatellispora tengchongensis TaxID=1073253 RepID=A0A840PH46_9ACTN|nr:branched-chain amino acid ABC transporter permease [Thermocatellispora tengchongensis]MBB5137253.1 branched-chain amino acid transport system permease protein [Thermocatellispora tengchongensis]